MLEELANESRADRYERWGHLLMASPGAVPRRTDRVELPDLFAAGEATTIPLDPLLDAVGNAQRYYDKARTTRQARAHAEERLVASEQRSEEAAALLETLRGLATVRDVERFKKEEAERLAKYLGQRADTEDRIPFRRYELAGGYEVWVGRNARQNDQLTFQHARKYDLWMHARGTPGSHTVLRLPARTAEPPPALLERAAAIAAYHSKARGSSLVPVIVVPRKYVRKPRGAAPGAVVVEREQVLLVAPELPE
jgi:predicted ribosome quality control (RQC) complex YloA/Tae2 family protein